MRRLISVWVLMGGLLVAGGANSAVTINFTQSGNDVFATASGTLTFTGSTFVGGNIFSAISPSDGRITFGGASHKSVICLTPTTGFGTGSIILGSSSGQVFGIFAASGLVVLPQSFQSGDNISSTVTFANTTLSSLGITQTTVYNCQNDTITILAPPPPPVPTVSTVNPTSGTTAGGTVITITGTNLTGATGITVGGTACTAFNVASATSATCTTPSGTAGTASVEVTVSGQTNAANTLFTYIAPTPPAPPAPPQPIPTLSEWAQILMMFLMIATAGFYGWRMKQR